MAFHLFATAKDYHCCCCCCCCSSSYYYYQHYHYHYDYHYYYYMCTFVVDAKHECSSLAVQERADVFRHGIGQVRVEIASSQLELSTASFPTCIFSSQIVLHTAPIPPAVALPARKRNRSQSYVIEVLNTKLFPPHTRSSSLLLHVTCVITSQYCQQFDGRIGHSPPTTTSSFQSQNHKSLFSALEGYDVFE